MTRLACRFCGAALEDRVVDLGMSPLCERYVTEDGLNQVELFYPLHVWVCRACLLVQLDEYVGAAELFSEYPYFSSYSTSWLAHCERYVTMIIDRLALDDDSFVLELASNDGYLLQYFVDRGIPCLGVEPAANVAAAAVERGVPTDVAFFSSAVASELVSSRGHADLVVGNNVLNQIPDLNDFVAGVSVVLAAGGTATFEFPHVIRLLDGNQFDTIYHEHFNYLSLASAATVFAAHGLTIFDVEELPTHGGSLRIYARHADEIDREPVARLLALRAREAEDGVDDIAMYARFEERVRETKRSLLEVLTAIKRDGKTIAGYGAPGKGNTLLNYCGIRGDFIDFTVDRNPVKQGRYLPGTHIPIHPPEQLDAARPDYIIILPWNLKDEIVEQLGHVRDWGTRFIVPIPHPEVV
jgi:predicted TPR repeat methyltransferase